MKSNFAVALAMSGLLGAGEVSAQEADSAISPTPAAESPPPNEATGSEGSNVARPQVEADARSAFLEGDRLYSEGDYEGALKSFERAYALSGRIEMLFNLANAHERQGDYKEASVALRGYIPHSPEAQRPGLERRLARLEELARKEEMKSVVVKAPAEKHPEKEQSLIRMDRALGYGLVTLGGISLATGVGFAISAGAARSDLSELCVEGEFGRLCPPEAEDALNRDKTHSIIADVAFIAGAALSAGGIYLLLRKDKSGEVRAEVGPSHVMIRGSF